MQTLSSPSCLVDSKSGLKAINVIQYRPHYYCQHMPLLLSSAESNRPKQYKWYDRSACPPPPTPSTSTNTCPPPSSLVAHKLCSSQSEKHLLVCHRHGHQASQQPYSCWPASFQTGGRPAVSSLQATPCQVKHRHLSCR